MTDEEILYVIKLVADAAWSIAVSAEAAPSVCLSIENLSDDIATSARMFAHIKARLARDMKSPDWDFKN